MANYCIRFGHSLWSVNRSPAQEVNFLLRFYTTFKKSRFTCQPRGLDIVPRWNERRNSKREVVRIAQNSQDCSHRCSRTTACTGHYAPSRPPSLSLCPLRLSVFPSRSSAFIHVLHKRHRDKASLRSTDAGEKRDRTEREKERGVRCKSIHRCSSDCRNHPLNWEVGREREKALRSTLFEMLEKRVPERVL